MKNKLRGWQKVFGFTIAQTTKGGGFKAVTLLISFLIIGLLIIITIASAVPEKEPEDNSVKQVIISDLSGLTETDYSAYIEAEELFTMDNVEFVPADDKADEQDLMIAAAQLSYSIAVLIEKTDTDYLMKAMIPEKSSVSYSDAEELLDVMATAFKANKLTQAGLSDDQLSMALSPILTSYSEVGDDGSIVTVMVQMFAPALFGLLLYFMLLFYGQNICQSLSTEKTSKLIETLLISVHPYALITGKVIGVAFTAILQFLAWIASALIGLYGGTAIAQMMYPEYDSSVISIIEILRDNIGSTALSLPAVILGVLIFCIGFIFFCVIAGLAGSMVTTPESAGTMQGIFLLPVVISFALCYITVLAKSDMINILRYIPFTTPFCVPVDVMTGNISILEGCIAGAILILFSGLVILLSAKIFKGLLLYNGQSISLKTIRGIMRTK